MEYTPICTLTLTVDRAKIKTHYPRTKTMLKDTVSKWVKEYGGIGKHVVIDISPKY